MRDAHRGIGGVDVLSPCPGTAHGINANVRSGDVDIDIFGLGQHSHSRGRGVDTPARLGRGHALHAVNTGFVFQLGKDAFALNMGRQFLDATKVRELLFKDFKRPAHALAIALIHPQQVGGKKAGLVTARAGANFKDGGAGISGVFGQKRQAQGGFHFRNAGLKVGQFLFRQGAHFRIGQHQFGFSQIVQRLAVSVDFGDHGAKVRILTAQRRNIGRRAARVQPRLDIVEALGDLGEFV